jgi:hypothetical protein
LLAISPQLPKYSSTLIKAKKLTFEILSDPGNAVAQKFGLIHSLPEDLRKIYLRFGIDLPKTNGLLTGKQLYDTQKPTRIIR